jgi:hypothetical protein
MKDNFTPFDPIRVGDHHEVREDANDLGRMILIPCARRGERNPYPIRNPSDLSWKSTQRLLARPLNK